MLATLTIRQLDFNIEFFISTKDDVDSSIGGTLLGGGLFVLSLNQPLKLNYLLAQRSFLKKNSQPQKKGSSHKRLLSKENTKKLILRLE